MSTHTMQWLNQNILVGNTAQRGNAWHYLASEQGAEPNHYEGFIPVADVERRLFAWNAIKAPIEAIVRNGDDDNAQSDIVPIFDRVAVMRDDTRAVFAIMSEKYTIHQYGEWLLNAVSTMLDDELGIESAGLLWNGAVAFVSVSVADSFDTKHGVEFRPNLLATTSHNGRIPTTYKRTSTLVVCDNTWQAAMRERTDEMLKIRHTPNSGVNITDARTALNIIYQLGEQMEESLNKLCEQAVTDEQFAALVKRLLPVEHDDARVSGRAKSTRDALEDLWRNHEFCQPWHGTAFGAVQTFNTYRQHFAPVQKTTNRIERQWMDAITGKTERLDNRVIELLATIG